MSTADVLVLGGSHTGKTHFAGQLLGRLRKPRSGRLRLLPGGVDDLSKLEEVLACLEEGRAAGHTPASTWTGVRCELESDDGVRASLAWPEYAGERLFRIVERRLVPDEWRVSVDAAKSWLLFIRPTTLRLYEDLLVRPTGIEPKHSTDERASVDGAGWDDRARYVELLQMLLFTAGQSTFRRAQAPRLAIALSCWDEYDTLDGPKLTPEQWLATQLPLLDAFVRSRWAREAWSVWGLSSLGRPLSKDEPDLEFAAKGPESFGYVLRPGGGQRDSDLTLPVAWLLGI